MISASVMKGLRLFFNAEVHTSLLDILQKVKEFKICYRDHVASSKSHIIFQIILDLQFMLILSQLRLTSLKA